MPFACVCVSFIDQSIEVLRNRQSNLSQIHLFSDGLVRTAIVILIAVDALIELAAAILIIVANVYCSGHSSLPSFTNFNYCKNMRFINLAIEFKSLARDLIF